MSSMQLLKKELQQILPIIGSKKVIYLDYPVHSNVGDLLILKGTLDFFKENNICVKYSYSVYDFDIRLLKEKTVKENVILVFHGGGNYGDLYAPHQELRRSVFKNMPNQSMILLPQSVYYENEKTEDKDIELIKNLKNATFCARDMPSYEHFKRGVNSVLLLPDMAHQLYGSIKNERGTINGALHFLREDKEKVGNQENICESSISIDWKDLMQGNDYKFIKSYRKLLVRVKNHGNWFPYFIRKLIFMVWVKFSNKLIDRSIRLFSQYESVLTSRLHGYILSYLLDIDTGYIDNNYNKISRYHSCWMKNINVE